MRNYAWRLGTRSVVQNIRRNLTMAAAITFGYVALVLVSGYSVRVTNYLSTSTIFLQESGHVSVFKADGRRKRFVRPKSYSLSATDAEALNAYLKSAAEVEFSAPYLVGMGLTGDGEASVPFLGRGFDPRVQERIRNHPQMRTVMPEQKAIESGDPIWKDAGRKEQVSLGRGLRKKLGDVSSVQLLTLDFDKRLAVTEAEVTGIYSTGLSVTEDLALQAPLPLLQELWNTDGVSYLAVFLKDGADPRSFAEQLKNDMQKEAVAVDAFAWDDARLNPEYTDAIAVLNVTVGFVALIVLFVVMLSILNTLNIGLAESRREIGTLLAIGYKARQVAFIYTVEAFLILLASLLVGAGCAYALQSGIIMLQLPFQLPGFSNASTFQLTPTLYEYVLCAGGISFLVLLATFFAARRYAGHEVLTLLDPGG